MRILIVEDEDAMAAGLKFNFEQEGFEVTLVGNGPDALREFQQAIPPVDLVILDLMLPGMSGYEVCAKIRETDKWVPVIVLSARTLTEDRMHAFDCGTDQYITKPFVLPELLNRVRNLLEREKARKAAYHAPRTAGETATSVYEFGQVRVDLGSFEISVGKRKHDLTTLEARLLQYFLEHEGQVLSRHDILEEVWDDNTDISTRTVDNFVVRLRRLIEPDPSVPRYILSVRGTGYRFVTGK